MNQRKCDVHVSYFILAGMLAPSSNVIFGLSWCPAAHCCLSHVNLGTTPDCAKHRHDDLLHQRSLASPDNQHAFMAAILGGTKRSQFSWSVLFCLPQNVRLIQNIWKEKLPLTGKLGHYARLHEQLLRYHLASYSSYFPRVRIPCGSLPPLAGQSRYYVKFFDHGKLSGWVNKSCKPLNHSYN